MISLEEIKNLVKEIPENKIQNIINYLKGKNPSSLKSMIIQDDLKIDSSQTNNLKKIFEQTSDGDLLSVVIQAISTQHKQNEDEISRLVMSWDFQHMDADYTHETIYDMIRRAKFKIAIIGYWVYKMEDFFKKLSELSETIEIKFILDDAKDWEKIIKKNWNKKSLPKFYKINRKKVKKNELKKIHSKIIIVDDSEILVTSANLTTVAMQENIETGIWTKDKKIVKACTEIFEDFERRKIIYQKPEKKY